MASLQMTTWKDIIDHVVDWLGANPSAEAYRDARRASLSAMRDLATAHSWTVYYTRGRLDTVAPQNTGTIQYQHSTGSSPRLVTLSDDTWPSWAAQGSLVINSITYQVATRLSDTTITLTSSSNPGTDVAAGATYALYRDTYPLPIDCQSIDQMTLVNLVWLLAYEHPGTWIQRQQIYRGQATPRFYTLRGDPHYQGALAVSFFPAPDAVYHMDYIYKRLPRQLKFDAVLAGKVTLTNGSASVTGTGTAWDSRMVGSVFRASADTQNLPTNYAGAWPYRYERIVVDVVSATELTLDAVVDSTLTGVKYVISDPVDIEPGAMLTCLLRGSEFQTATSRTKKDREEARMAYERALLLAREADARNFGESAAGVRRPYPYRLAYMPGGPDVS